MVRTLTIAAMLLSAGAGMSAHAQRTLSGNDLERCGQFCSGYVLGFSAGLMIADASAGGSGICMPMEVSSGQMLDVVRAYIRANPKDRHKPLEALVAIAYLNAWPCKPVR
jgi:Rap1a immunity proteins